ncbi:MAG: hypothetical protein GY759_14635 [Chloroflexi bacterium]|nr:hypothetical protein [Chloroflexota bacterium]
MDIAVYDTIGTVVDGSFEGGSNFFGTLENGGVGLASYHDFEDKVPDELKAEIEAIIQGIIAGDIQIN